MPSNPYEGLGWHGATAGWDSVTPTPHTPQRCTLQPDTVVQQPEVASAEASSKVSRSYPSYMRAEAYGGYLPYSTGVYPSYLASPARTELYKLTAKQAPPSMEASFVPPPAAYYAGSPYRFAAAPLAHSHVYSMPRYASPMTHEMLR